MIEKEGWYQHYKGGKYQVLGFARHSESLEPLVIYRAMGGDEGTWARPLTMFLEYVPSEEEGGRRIPRFKSIPCPIDMD